MNWDEYKAQRDKEKRENYDRAIATFSQAHDLAKANGWRLCRCSKWHFQLILFSGDCLYHLYPSNQRIYADPHHKAPFLKIQRPWTFLDVVSAAIIHENPELMEKNNGKEESQKIEEKSG